ncbi:hypothetical protein RDI58_028925 [Solanum bulbocastanum]|uniref:Uncharacterized protein n=1 Tax=Solanum bulbocastanum TaxID=147425 RepID=A0AAN8SVV9_SOLBU
MVGKNDKHLPCIWFIDAASRERHHDYWNTTFCCEMGFVLHQLEEKEPAFYARLGVGIPLNGTTIKEVLEVSEVPNHAYEDQRSEMDLEWLRDTLVEPTCWDHVYWATAEGITSMDWSPDAKKWLHWVTRRIRLSSNHHLRGENVLSRQQKDFFLPRLIIALCSTFRSERRRIGKANNSKAAANSNDDDPLSSVGVEDYLEVVRKMMGSAYADSPPVPPSTALEVEMLHRQLCQERRKDVDRDRLMIQMWKTIKAIFTCVAPGKEIPKLDPKDFT